MSVITCVIGNRETACYSCGLRKKLYQYNVSVMGVESWVFKNDTSIMYQLWVSSCKTKSANIGTTACFSQKKSHIKGGCPALVLAGMLLLLPLLLTLPISAVPQGPASPPALVRCPRPLPSHPATQDDQLHTGKPPATPTR